MTDFKVLEGDGNGRYASVDEREKARNEIHQIVTSVIADTFPTTPGASTTIIPLSSTTNSAKTMFATDSIATRMHPTMTDCSGPEWRRVAFINMTNTSYNCPTGLNLTSYSKRTCGRSHTTDEECSSTTFSVGGLPYSHVCGRIRGYQFGATGAFGRNVKDIDSYYVEGVSLTHGASSSRQHIWTFAAGRSEVTRCSDFGCPCDTGPHSIVPAFVGNDYFCESGLHSEWNTSYDGVLFPDDVLWDGQNCTSNSTCCQFNNPPWFTKNLTNATTDDIELRICTIQMLADIPLELIELYVQ